MTIWHTVAMDRVNSASLEGAVDVWRIQLAHYQDHLAALLALLSPEELERAARFRVAHAYHAFVVTRGVLRILLGKYLRSEPSQLVFSQNQYGKPYLEQVALQFNVSHSQGIALLAFTLNTALGVDVEFMRQALACEQIVRECFSPREGRAFSLLPESQKLPAFFNSWARKEAVVKALGTGLFRSIKEIEVPVTHEQIHQATLQLDLSQGQHFYLESFECGQGYAAALALQGPSRKQLHYSEPAELC